MKLRKLNPPNGGKDQPFHTPYLFGQLIVACFKNSSRHIIASLQAIVFEHFRQENAKKYPINPVNPVYYIVYLDRIQSFRS
jgi:hypothetical protein